MTKIALTPNASGTGTFTIAAPNSNNTRTLTLPDVTGTVLTTAGGTLTGALTGTDLTLSGGVYLGGTGSANLLDDYEEGTWTPTTTGLTGVTILNARYRKIGSLVTVDIRLSWTGSDGTNLALSLGIPFTSTSESGSTAQTGAVFYQGTQTYASVVSHIGTSETSVSFYSGGGGAFSAVLRNQVNGSYNWLVTNTYITDA
jgi:hypothetical protein